MLPLDLHAVDQNVVAAKLDTKATLVERPVFLCQRLKLRAKNPIPATPRAFAERRPVSANNLTRLPFAHSMQSPMISKRVTHNDGRHLLTPDPLNLDLTLRRRVVA